MNNNEHSKQMNNIEHSSVLCNNFSHSERREEKRGKKFPFSRWEFRTKEHTRSFPLLGGKIPALRKLKEANGKKFIYVSPLLLLLKEALIS